MSRYIDADLLKDKTTRVNNIWNSTTNAEGKGLDEIIDDIPTADVVEVVRCKDCKYRSKEWYEDKRNKDGGYWLVCCENDAIAERVYGLAQDNDYCSYGEEE